MWCPDHGSVEATSMGCPLCNRGGQVTMTFLPQCSQADYNLWQEIDRLRAENADLRAQLEAIKLRSRWDNFVGPIR
jgi:hypothetical protein